MSEIENLKQSLASFDSLEFALLFGSRARGNSHEDSDWDIAVSFKDNTQGLENLAQREYIRHAACASLGVDADKVDVVDVYRGGLSINATIVDEAIALIGGHSLALALYYQRIWANLEDHDWNVKHAI